jgi:hypothetical protein
MLSYVLPEPPGRRLGRLPEALRVAIGDLWVDSRHDVLGALINEYGGLCDSVRPVQGPNPGCEAAQAQK